MSRLPRLSRHLCWIACAIGSWTLDAAPLDGTAPPEIDGDLSVRMVEGIDRWLDREHDRVATLREQRWSRDARAVKTRDDYFKLKREQQELLRTMIGAVDERRSGALQVIAEPGAADKASEGFYSVERVRWPVFEGVSGEGLLLRPRGAPTAAVIALPDAGQTPEQFTGLQPGLEPSAEFARRLVERGALVVVMTLVDRRDDWSGNAQTGRFTNQPHREWIYRQSFEVGRTLIGYEVQKVLAAVDALKGRSAALAPGVPVGLLGYGEGGRTALTVAALDARVETTFVSGAFGASATAWSGPIDRNLMGYARDFGDAELAEMIRPRGLVLEFADLPALPEPSQREGRARTAAPAKAATVKLEEFLRLAKLPESSGGDADEGGVRFEPWPVLGMPKANPLAPALPLTFRGTALPGSTDAFDRFATERPLKLRAAEFQARRTDFDQSQIDARQRRTVNELTDHSQRVFRASERARKARPLWAKLKPGTEWDAVQKAARAEFWEKTIGKLSTDYLPANPRSRQIHDEEKWRGYDVMLDVHPDVFAWGVLLVPKDLKAGERRPVVVCQHGLEGLPGDTITADKSTQAWKAYKGFAAQLADRGFVVYAPHNPYRGQEKFRWLQRKANPLGLSLFSFIIAQHDVTTRWLASLPFVDPERIGFYGLSYGGKTAMRVPAVLDRYCLSICSADFNEWVLKCVSDSHPSGYIFSPEWEIWEWDLAHTFNYAEMALLIAPRPFMVERGHEDAVGLDEHVGYEWAKVLRGYTKLGIADRAEIEWFDGPHTINGQGTFRFLHKWLRWPER